MKKLVSIFISLAIIFTLTACGSGPGGDEAAAGNDSTTVPDTAAAPESTPIVPARAPMNAPGTIIEGMEALMGPSYEVYGRGVDAVHLTLPDDFDPKTDRYIEFTWPSTWELGRLTILLDDGQVNEVFAQGIEHVIANNVTAALFASAVQGMTPEEGQKIADALRVGDYFDFAMQYEKENFVVEHKEYYFIVTVENLYHPRVIPAEGQLNYDRCVLFDIDGNEIESP